MIGNDPETLILYAFALVFVSVSLSVTITLFIVRRMCCPERCKGQPQSINRMGGDVTREP